MATVWEQAEFKLMDKPVVALDGTVYRWQTVLQPRRCPCNWEWLCMGNVEKYGAPLCETYIMPELTGEGWMIL